MKNYKKLIVGSLMTAIMIASPAMSFADNDKGRGEEKGEQRKEQKEDRKEEKREEKNNKYGNWFNSGWFNSKNSKKVTNAPVVSDLSIISTKGKKATIKWSTDVRSNSMIWYSKTPSIDTTKAPTMKRNNRVLKHKFELNKLEPNTVYYVVVGGSTNGGIGKSIETSFTTGGVSINISIPVITSATGTATMKVGEEASFTFNAYDPQNKALTYEVVFGDGSTVASTAFNQTVTLKHVYNTVGTYVVKFTVTNSDSKKATYPIQIKVTPTVTADTTAPIISGTTMNIGATSTTIAWTTNEPSTSTVYYGTTTPIDTNSLATLKVTNASMVKNHSLTIPSLTSNTLYHFIIKSVDASNNVTLSSNATFTTGN